MDRTAPHPEGGSMSHVTEVVSSLRARLTTDEDGATMVEYGLLIALIAAAVISVLLLLGPNISGMFTEVNNGITGVSDGSTD